ncbi:MAG: hypothetical protein NW215_10860 [Hyphomicrobiales bacterium]|nr:hypothetical protein [Hyphomicrobiales bacterium]
MTTNIHGRRIAANTLSLTAIPAADRPYSKAEVDSLVNGKSSLGHGHAQGDITGLTTALAGKSNTGHGHAQSEITGLVSALAAKADATALDAKAGFTTSADAALATFPIGSLLLADTSGNVDRNASRALYLKSGNTFEFTDSSGGAALAGTWRQKGRVGSSCALFQRVA